MDNKAPAILFIGNSYTHYNEMPYTYFTNILKDAGFTVDVKMITKGGWYLKDSARSDDEVGMQVEEALANKKYDFVVLQEQSTCPAIDNETFFGAIRILNAKVRANGATPILYNTWGRKTGGEFLTQYNLTNESMTKLLVDSYDAIGKELGIQVAHVGLAFRDVFVNHPEIELYAFDFHHPSPMGSYLAALTIFAQITKVDPTTLSYDDEFDPEFTKVLKEAAKKAVFNC